ncbi:MAG: aminopeptidase P family protein [Saprospirales bacterium]|nr:aminopeptidase P family protein [Saprospirales bacterium]
MFDKKIYLHRRAGLLKNFDKGLILLLGNHDVAYNYKGNTYPHFRQDSTFLYYFGLRHAGMAALLDPESGAVTLFGDDLTLEDVVWMGPQPRIAELAAEVGVSSSAPFGQLSAELAKAKSAGRKIHFLPPYRYRNMFQLQQWLDIPVEEQGKQASVPLIKAVVAQRSLKGPEEVAEMEKALAVTAEMHLAVMKGAKPGRKEAELAGLAEGIAASHDGYLSYSVILSIKGHILHNHDHGNILKAGDLLLGDFGAETTMCYAGDITRTIPVGGVFSAKQKDIYQVVLDAQMAAIQACRPGVRYRDIHLQAARNMAGGLHQLGLMKGDLDEAVAQGAHALFFPHGLGHMIGLDVHDMEDLGEQYVGYTDQIPRSTLFGTGYLRLARELEPGFVLTVEPGLYFIPELIDQWKAERKFEAFINYEAVESFRHFGGIRTEDNVLITDTGHRVLGPAIPKGVAELEASMR